MLLTMDMSLNGASPLKSNQGFNCPETKNNKMKKNIFLFCLLIIGVLQANAQTEKFTLRQTIDTALKNNILLSKSNCRCAMQRSVTGRQ